jgi:hypothetical protein
MPVLGFGVYQNYDAKPSCLEAFKAGYRSVTEALKQEILLNNAL